MKTALLIVLIVLLALVNGAFAMGEMALVSARRARLTVLEGKHVRGAARARELAEDPHVSCRPCRWASPWSAFYPARSAASGSRTR